MKSLYMPFVKFEIEFLLLHNIFYYLNLTENEYSIGDIVKEVFNPTIRITSSGHLIGAMWFYPALLIASLYVSQMANIKIIPTIKIQNKYTWIILPFVIFIIRLYSHSIPH